MSTIKLPPLPERETDGLRSWWTADQVRARDLEVAKCVLEAAAQVCENPGPYWDWDDFTNAVRALEFKHE